MKTKKKKGFTKNGTLFSANSSGHLRSDAHQSQIIWGGADVDHTQTIGGYNQIIGGIYSPRVSAPLRVNRASATEAVDSGSIPGRVKPKTIKIGINSFPA